jgi:two-component system NtrC family response regulator
MKRPRILVVEDDALLNQLLVGQLDRMGYDTVGVGRWSQAQTLIEDTDPSLVILDGRLPDADGIELLPQICTQQPVIILTAYASVQNAVRAIKLGAAEYLVKPVNLDELELVVKRALDNAALRRENQYLKSRISADPFAMIGRSPGLAAVNQQIDAVAPSDMTVLIQGESGVGKELVAKAIHARSLRAGRTFVPVDCCTLQKQLFESELFGHEKGAFTGADKLKKGLIEGAEGGTLFLDEIGEIEPAVQAKLLRVLETGRFRRVGGTKDHDANVRIVAATNRDLAALSRQGGFRSDLFYRLSAFLLSVPPLRERRPDVAEIARHFIRNHSFSRRIEKVLSAGAVTRLEDYDWPGNIRELKNVVERAIILSGESAAIGVEHLAIAAVPAIEASRVAAAPVDLTAEPSLEEVKRQYLKLLLDRYDGHRGKVARVLGISERNTYRLISKFDLGPG